MSEKRTDGIVDLGLVEDGDTYPDGDADDAHRYGHNLDRSEPPRKKSDRHG